MRFGEGTVKYVYFQSLLGMFETMWCLWFVVDYFKETDLVNDMSSNGEMTYIFDTLCIAWSLQKTVNL